MTQFEGFEPANTTPVPDVLFDQLLTELTGAELKAMLYIIRRTWGFKKNEDTISLSQFQNGITTRDGRVLDKGCGVKDRTTLIRSLNALEKKGYIKSTKPRRENGEHETTQYAIRFKGDAVGSGENRLPRMDTLPQVVGKTDYPSVDIHTTPSGENPTTRSGQTRRTRNSNTRDSLQETVQQEVRSAAVADTPRTPLKKQIKKTDLFENASPEVQTIITEWRAIFKTPPPITAKLIEQAATLAAYQPAAGEITSCRLWMYQTDTKKWYSQHGMNLGTVATQFEKYRSLANVPQVEDKNFVNGQKRKIYSSFDDPTFDAEQSMREDFYPVKPIISQPTEVFA